MVLFFIIQFSGYWIQTDWSGGEGQYSWVDSNSYFVSENMDGKVFTGLLGLSAPSGKWESFGLPVPVKQANVISEADPGILYVGCGWDSARVFKFGDFGNSLLARNSLGAGEVISLQVLHNGDVLAGTSTGRLWIGKDSQWMEVANFGTPILKLYQPPDFNWIYLGTANGIIWVDENGSGLTWNYYEALPNIQKVLDIFESSWGYFYACTKSTDGKGRIFRSLYSGQHWDTLNYMSLPGLGVKYL
ncbi:MAG: hypothetical protein HY769_06150 [Candidatus Stahlbacteria bacterium]|nr:hypothetical protein [Candidatus Stahlbacteria bacterium]